MKKSVFVASLIVATAAIADSTTVETDYTVGVMPVSSDLEETIVSVPWVGDGENGEIAVTNLIKTAGLTFGTEEHPEDGDTVSWFNGSNYIVWNLVSNETDGVCYWVKKSTRTRGGESSEEADAPAIAQGDAVVLSRKSTSSTIYVIGNVGTSGELAYTVTQGYNLIASPNTAPTNFNDGSFDWSGVADGDYIYINTVGASGDVLKVYTYESGKWGESTYDSSEREWVHGTTATIPAGQGFYYFRNSSDPMTIRWTGVPSITAE